MKAHLHAFLKMLGFVLGIFALAGLVFVVLYLTTEVLPPWAGWTVIGVFTAGAVGFILFMLCDIYLYLVKDYRRKNGKED